MTERKTIFRSATDIGQIIFLHIQYKTIAIQSLK